MAVETKSLVLKLPLSELVPGISFHLLRSVIMFRDGSRILAARNVCKHQGGKFLAQGGGSCLLRCPNHGWVLDASTMGYVNPRGELAQDQLIVEVSLDQLVGVYERVPPAPWEQDPKPVLPLSSGELTLCFWAHACMEFKLGNKRLVSDPWLVGPAFSRGWWLLHRPPANWLERLASADAIYVSHNHTDHLNRYTLEKLLQANPDVPFFVPDFASGSSERPLRKMGFRNIRSCAFSRWQQIDDDTRIMILADAAGRDDSGLLIEYKGHRILDAVDCSNMNNGVLPDRLDVLLHAFAGGASGYPVCWQEMYAEEKISATVSRNTELAMNLLIGNARKTNARVVVPFAGYFTEAHPADSEIKRLNRKNTADEVELAVASRLKDVLVWKPQPGQVFDVAMMNADPPYQPGDETKPDEHDFGKYLQLFQNELDASEFHSLDKIRDYFLWSGFHDNLVLHLLETDDSFTQVNREFMFDFHVQDFVDERPDRTHQYTRIKVRQAVFHHVLNNKLPWEEFSIGFQARFFRDPDVYEFNFWNHFQNNLPCT